MAASRQVKFVLRIDKDIDSEIDRVKSSLKSLKKNIKENKVRAIRGDDLASENDEIMSKKIVASSQLNASEVSFISASINPPYQLGLTDPVNKNQTYDFSRLIKILIIVLCFNILITLGLAVYVISSNTSLSKPDLEPEPKIIAREPEPKIIVTEPEPKGIARDAKGMQDQQTNAKPLSDQSSHNNGGSFLGNVLYYGGGAIFVASTLPILAGFGTAGIAAGSVAAGVQAAIGNVAAGSAFATVTSLGMQGTLATGSAAGAAGFTAGLFNITGWFF